MPERGVSRRAIPCFRFPFSFHLRPWCARGLLLVALGGVCVGALVFLACRSGLPLRRPSSSSTQIAARSSQHTCPLSGMLAHSSFTPRLDGPLGGR